MSRDIINGAYDINFLPTQQRVIDCISEMKTPNICLCEGFGGGKTRLGGEIVQALSMTYPGIQGGVFRKTRVAVSETTYKTFIRKVAPPEYLSGNSRISNLYCEYWNKSGAQFLGIDNFLRKGSFEFDYIICDEGIEFEEADFRMLEGRLRSQVIPLPLMIILTNAGAPKSYLHKTFVENEEKGEAKDNDYAYFEANSFENTYNPKAYFARLEKWKGTQYYARWVLSKWEGFEGIIFSVFTKQHIIKPFRIPSEWKKFLFVDFGFEHPMALLWCAYDPIHDIFYIYRQFYRIKWLVKHVVEFARSISERSNEIIETIICDHDAENRAQFEEYWKETVPAIKSVQSYIQTTIERMLPRRTDGKFGMYIFDDAWQDKDGLWYGLVEKDVYLEQVSKPTCLQEEIPKYIWGKNDIPVKDNDHACNALCYGFHTLKFYEGSEGGMQIATHSSFSRR